MKISKFMENVNLQKSQEAINYMALLLTIGDEYYDRETASMVLDPEYNTPGLRCTYMWIGEDDEGDAELLFKDCWEDGYVKTGVGSLGVAEAYFTDDGYLVI